MHVSLKSIRDLGREVAECMVNGAKVKACPSLPNAPFLSTFRDACNGPARSLGLFVLVRTQSLFITDLLKRSE